MQLPISSSCHGRDAGRLQPMLRRDHPMWDPCLRNGVRPVLGNDGGERRAPFTPARREVMFFLSFLLVLREDEAKDSGREGGWRVGDGLCRRGEQSLDFAVILPVKWW